MITFLTGVPGSGKTYYAVHNIYKNFMPKTPELSPIHTLLIILRLKQKPTPILTTKYLHCYTNINEFKFQSIGEVAKPLDMDLLKEKLYILYDLYLQKVSDDELNEKAKELELYKAFFVIDECHNYFDHQDTVLIWWLSYHRHMYQELFLITQNLDLIHSKYKKFSEFFYKAHASSVKLFKNVFKYSAYLHPRLFEKSKSHVIKIQFNQEVFNLYHSGDNQKSPNVILRFLAIASLFLVAALFLIYFWTMNKKDEFLQEKQKTETTTKNPTPKPKNLNLKKSTPQSHFDLNQYTYTKISCSGTYCNYNHQSIPESVIRFVIRESGSKILESKSNPTFNTKELYCFLNEAFKSKFQQRSPHENTQNINPIDMFRSH
ncbi:MAG: zonular occludens toxin domain-containing protein [Epsilonproteobacteria bacterium]|nr:zonular occludens toxin domain-containing protein [Campylobacterota bacterium]